MSGLLIPNAMMASQAARAALGPQTLEEAKYEAKFCAELYHRLKTDWSVDGAIIIEMEYGKNMRQVKLDKLMSDLRVQGFIADIRKRPHPDNFCNYIERLHVSFTPPSEQTQQKK